MRLLTFLLLLLSALWLHAAAPTTNAPPADANATDQNASAEPEGGDTGDAGDEEEKEEKKTWLSEFLNTGPIGLLIKGGWFMAPILLLAILVAPVSVDCNAKFRNSGAAGGVTYLRIPR